MAAGQQAGRPARPQPAAVALTIKPEPRRSISGGTLIDELAAGDRQARSWREKLEFARGLLARDRPRLATDELVVLAVYLRFLGTGEIVCQEDGRHFRPAHHARIASEIRERLACLSIPENAFVLRKIYPWLPSSAADFRRPEPLTRIRDIAHRNDIDPELKRELKTTLQNKLHRCAGPEDLETSSALLARITAPGAKYSPAFVEQFRIFHEELKEFFNAQSLEARLEALEPAADSDLAEGIRSFLQQKTGASLVERLAAFRSLTALREALPRGPWDRLHERTPLPGPLPFGRGEGEASAGCAVAHTVDPSASAVHPAQPPNDHTEFLLADIALEDFAFALLSDLINQCENADEKQAGDARTEALILALKNLRLSAINPAESRVLASELEQWGKLSQAADRDEVLRLKACLLRCRRLAEDFGVGIVDLFSGPVEHLGRALGVAPAAIRVFCESDLRSHLVFQISKLATALLRQIRRRLQAPAWDVLVSGRASGKLRVLDSIDNLARGSKEPALVLLKSAAGDEEIPGQVTGIVLCHELPHLSHLSVRGRQAGVILVTCEDPAESARLRQLEGQSISLLALPDAVSWETAGRAQSTFETGLRDRAPGGPLTPALSPSEGEREKHRQLTRVVQIADSLIRIPPARLCPRPPWIPLEQATLQTSGGKADGARRLAELSRQEPCRFRTPPGLVIPFGVMEAALAAKPDVHREFTQLLKEIERNNKEPGALARQLTELIQRVAVPQSIVSEASRRFGPGAALIVRSSANCEDLEYMAGAGLYESVINVAPQDVAGAVRKVWSSLWTERAVLSRAEAGIPHDQARMAVLIQELLEPDLSFVLHTVDPVRHNAQEVYAEIVVGLGETLVSAATHGTAYRLTCDKRSGAVVTLAFANFGQAARPNPGGGIKRETVDYSRIDLSREAAAREKLGRRLAQIGAFVEQALGKPQDIEGAVVNDEICLVQARAQQGLPRSLANESFKTTDEHR